MDYPARATNLPGSQSYNRGVFQHPQLEAPSEILADAASEDLD